MEKLYKQFVFLIYHKIASGLMDYFTTIVSNAKKRDTIAGETFIGMLPIKRVKWSGIVFIALLLLHRILHTSLQSSDLTALWIGTLSVECAVGLGLTAISQWYAKSSYQAAGRLISAAINHNFLKWDEAAQSKTFDEFLKEFMERESHQLDITAARITFNGISIVVGSVVLMPMAIWFPDYVQTSLLMSTLIWLLGSLGSLAIMLLLSFQDTVWKFYELIKAEHDSDLTVCPICSKTITRAGG